MIIGLVAGLLQVNRFTDAQERMKAMKTPFNHDDQGNKLVVYTRQSQKDPKEKRKEPPELQEANLFVLARKLGWQERTIVIL